MSLDSELQWQSVKIGDLGKVVTGGTPPTQRTEFFGHAYPFITPTDMTDTDRHVRTERYLSEEGYKSQSQRVLPNNAVCFVCIGATIGKICLTDRTSFTNQQINSIVVDEIHHDPRFIYYLLRTQGDHVKCIAGGAATPIVNKSSFANLEVRVPPLATQRKIADILSAYDDLIENNARRIKILEEMAQTIYREWFVHFRFPGHEQAAMVETELGLMPEGWEPRRLADIATLHRDGVVPSAHNDELFHHYSIPAFDAGREPVAEYGHTIRSNKYLVHPDCVLLSKLNPRIPRVWLPFLANTHRSIASTEFLVLTAGSELNRYFLHGLCSLPEFLEKFSSMALGTSTSHQRVKPEDLLDMVLLLPTPQTLEDYATIVEPMLMLSNALRLRNANLRQTRDMLLPKLVSGEIDMNELSLVR